MEQLKSQVSNFFTCLILNSEPSVDFGKSKQLAQEILKTKPAQQVILDTIVKLHPIITGELSKTQLSNAANSYSAEPQTTPKPPKISIDTKAVTSNYESLKSKLSQIKQVFYEHNHNKQEIQFELRKEIEKVQMNLQHSDKLVNLLNEMNQYEPDFIENLRDISHDTWRLERQYDKLLQKEMQQFYLRFDQMKTKLSEKILYIKQKSGLKIQQLETQAQQATDNNRKVSDKVLMFLSDIESSQVEKQELEKAVLEEADQEAPIEDLPSALQKIENLKKAKLIQDKNLVLANKSIKELEGSLKVKNNSISELKSQVSQLESNALRLKAVSQLILGKSSFLDEDKKACSKMLREDKVAKLEHKLTSGEINEKAAQEFLVDEFNQFKETIKRTITQKEPQKAVELIDNFKLEEVITKSKKQKPKKPKKPKKLKPKKPEPPRSHSRTNQRHDSQTPIEIPQKPSSTNRLAEDPSSESLRVSDSEQESARGEAPKLEVVVKVDRAVTSKPECKEAQTQSEKPVENYDFEDEVPEVSEIPKPSELVFQDNAEKNFEQVSRKDSLRSSQKDSQEYSQEDSEGELQKNPQNYPQSYYGAPEYSPIKSQKTIKRRSSIRTEHYRETPQEVSNFKQNLTRFILKHFPENPLGIKNLSNPQPLRKLLSLQLEETTLENLIFELLENSMVPKKNNYTEMDTQDKLKNQKFLYSPLVRNLVRRQFKVPVKKQDSQENDLLTWITNTQKSAEEAAQLYLAEFEVHKQEMGLKKCLLEDSKTIWNSVISRRLEEGEEDIISKFLRGLLGTETYESSKGKVLQAVVNNNIDELAETAKEFPIRFTLEKLVPPPKPSPCPDIVYKWKSFTERLQEIAAKKLYRNIAANDEQVLFEVAKNVKHVKQRMAKFSQRSSVSVITEPPQPEISLNLKDNWFKTPRKLDPYSRKFSRELDQRETSDESRTRTRSTRRSKLSRKSVRFSPLTSSSKHSRNLTTFNFRLPNL